MKRWALGALVLVGCGTTASVPRSVPEGMIAIPGAGFALDRTPVTVATFRAAGASTLAEREGGAVIDLSTGAWRIVPGATYERPEGGAAAGDEEPATQITWDEATAFCAARGARLPTEAEWERAARNGAGGGATYPWGDDARDGVHWRLNAWQGAFPTANTLEDGYLFASPVGAFPPTPIGLVDMVGNVWQWTSSPFDERQRAIRGGSFLCDPNVCHGYRIAARQGASPDSPSMHIGFRCAL